MHFSQTEASQLFADEQLLSPPSVSLVIAFAEGYLPGTSELALLGNIVSKGYGCSSSLVHYYYNFNGKTDSVFFARIEHIQPDLTLVFDPATQDIHRAQASESVVVFLPDLDKIDSNLETKKALWSILKEVKQT